MAAIAGWAVPARSARDEQAIAPMLEALAHRGRPGESLDAIVERRSRCQVVMGVCHVDEPSQISLSLDGAIANKDELRAALQKKGHHFTARSDAEVVLRAYQHWDKDALKHLRGAFALALWDGGKERLLLARDRFGEKPLHLQEGAGGLTFASELKAFRGGEIDMEAVWQVLAQGYVSGPRTLVAGVRKLVPGTYALWQFGRLSEIRYWTPPDGAPAGEEKEASVDDFVAELEEAVRLRMEPSCGAFLSGGLDSAAIVALMCRHGKRIATFSAGIEGDKHSELAQAKRAAEQFGTEHHEVVFTPKQIAERLPQVVGQRDAPLTRASDVALQLLSAEAAKSVKTVLTGEGGDEILGGYRRYALERYSWGLSSLPTLAAIATPLESMIPGLRKAAAALRAGDWRERYRRWTGGDDFSGALVSSGVKGGGFENLKVDPRSSALRRMLFVEQSSWLPDQVLERGDRVTMAASLEARSPFVDHRLAEHVSRLPDEARVSGLGTKRILHRAAGRLFGAGKLSPRKGGFRIAVGALLAGELREFLLEHLRGAGSLTRAWYEPKALDRAIDQHLSGRRNHEGLLWTLLNLEIWYRHRCAAARRA